MKVFHADADPEKIWAYFVEETEGEGLEDYADGDSEEELKERLLAGFDVQGEDKYWNLVEAEVEA